MGHGGWGAHGGRGYSSGPTPAKGLGDLDLSNTSVHNFAAVMQGVMVTYAFPEGWQEMGTCLPSGRRWTREKSGQRA